jgi:hypothetical protein
MTSVTQITPSYNIVAYPLDAVVHTPKLYFSGNDEHSQSWSYDPKDAVIYSEYMEAFKDLMQIKRKNNLFLILINNEHKTN